MISRGDCQYTLDALTRQGWVLEKRGHIVLTAKARARRLAQPQAANA
jgi:hypothetical protein